MTVYGSGVLYGAATAIYGRISAELAAAQATSHRETALKVRVIDQRLNRWESVSHLTTYDELGVGRMVYRPINGGVRAHQLAYYSYRGDTSITKLGNGNFVRVRIGDPATSSDRQVWVQTITDPTVGSQWTSWSVLYSGTHYSATVKSDGTSTGYNVFHSKSDGIYVNNSLAWAGPGGVKTPWKFYPILGPGSGVKEGYVAVIYQHTVDLKRIIDFYYTPNLGVTTPTFEKSNFNYIRPTISGYRESGGDTIARMHGIALHHDPREGDFGITNCVTFQDAGDDTITSPYIVRGIGGGAGRNYSLVYLFKLSDGYYYVFGHEVHEDQSFEGVTSLGHGMPVWSRSKDLLHWSDFTIGPGIPNTWGFGGVVEANGYLYWSDNQHVYRRPTTAVTYDVSNYVPTVQIEIPRDNQPGTGNCVVANPAGINDALVGLSDREIIIEPGLRVVGGSYEYIQPDRLYIRQVNREIKGKLNRLNVEFGNVWQRLDVELRDVTNFVGKTDWNDFSAGQRNEAFNYFFVTDTSPSVDDENFRLTTSGICLYTGWKGHHPDITASFAGFTGNPRIYIKYVDVNNHVFVEVGGGTVSLKEVVAGTTTTVTSSGGSGTKIRVQTINNYYKVWVNDALILNGSTFWKHNKQGYVGFGVSSGGYSVGSFHLEDWEYDLTIGDLIKTALASVDFHDFIVGGADDKAYAIVWGPQTDNAKIGDALRNILTTEKLQLVFRNGMVEVGRFNDPTIVRTIQNEIIESEQVDEVSRRINFASVDGNTHFWMEMDIPELHARDRVIVGYYDLPELLTLEAVKQRAREEIRRSAQGASPGGMTPMFFDLWRMDHVTWVDNLGNSKTARIEGFNLDINQSKEPFQRQTFDTSEPVSSSSSGIIDSGADTE